MDVFLILQSFSKALKKFKEQHGHCKIPRNHPDFGNWPIYQKAQYKLFEGGKKSKITAEKVDRLISIGFLETTNKQPPGSGFAALKGGYDAASYDDNSELFILLLLFNYAHYTFFTSNDLCIESIAFSSNCGGHHFDAEANDVLTKANPVLGWSDLSVNYHLGAPYPAVITGEQFREICSAKLVLLYKSRLQFNARQVEDELQRRYMHLKLGKNQLPVLNMSFPTISCTWLDSFNRTSHQNL